MDIEKEYSCLEQNKTVFKKCVEVDENYQEALQAYCDDLYRIIKCSAHSYVTSVDINYNEIKIFGKTEICVTYYDEASNLCYADFDEEFTKTIEAEGLSDSAFANAVACDKYCSFRVINQRRIDVHCSFVLSVSVYDKQSCPCISSCEGSRLKIEPVKSANVINSCISRLEFDEELELPKQVKRVICASGNVFIDEIKVIKDKALIKLNACVKLLYVVDGSDGVERHEHSFSASKIVDINGIDDGCYSVSSADIGCLYFKIKNTSSEDSSLVQLYGDMVVNILFVCESEIDVITDGYILNHNSICDYSSYPCSCNGSYINEEKQQAISFDFNNEIKEIYDLSVDIPETEIKNGKIISKISATVVCKTSEGDLSSFSASADVEMQNTQRDSGSICALAKSYDYSLGSNGRINVRLTYLLNGYLYNEKVISVLSELNAEDEEVKYPALTVYFGKKDEAVWSIAKSFSSDIDLIIRENELQGDILDANKVLIIPGI